MASGLLCLRRAEIAFIAGCSNDRRAGMDHAPTSERTYYPYRSHVTPGTMYVEHVPP